MNTHDIELLSTIHDAVQRACNYEVTVLKASEEIRAAIEADRKHRREPAVEACHAIKPFLDSIICYASTTSESEGNRAAKLVEDVCAAFPLTGKAEN